MSVLLLALIITSFPRFSFLNGNEQVNPRFIWQYEVNKIIT